MRYLSGRLLPPLQRPTTKGDLLAYDGSLLRRLGSGDEGQVLLATPGADAGLGWANVPRMPRRLLVASSNMPASVTESADHVVSDTNSQGEIQSLINDNPLTEWYFYGSFELLSDLSFFAPAIVRGGDPSSSSMATFTGPGSIVVYSPPGLVSDISVEGGLSLISGRAERIVGDVEAGSGATGLRHIIGDVVLNASDLTVFDITGNVSVNAAASNSHIRRVRGDLTAQSASGINLDDLIGGVVLNGISNFSLSGIRGPVTATGINAGSITTEGPSLVVTGGSYIQVRATISRTDGAGHGVILDGVTRCTLSGSVLVNGGGNEYDGVHVTGECLFVILDSLTVSYVQLPRYGIFIDEDCVSTGLNGVTFVGETEDFGTADLDDNGTDTIMGSVINLPVPGIVE